MVGMEKFFVSAFFFFVVSAAGAPRCSGTSTTSLRYQQIPEEAGRWESRETAPICKKILQICPGYFQEGTMTTQPSDVLTPKLRGQNVLWAPPCDPSAKRRRFFGESLLNAMKSHSRVHHPSMSHIPFSPDPTDPTARAAWKSCSSTSRAWRDVLRLVHIPNQRAHERI